jgi:hypothetical protein
MKLKKSVGSEPYFLGNYCRGLSNEPASVLFRDSGQLQGRGIHRFRRGCEEPAGACGVAELHVGWAHHPAERHHLQGYQLLAGQLICVLPSRAYVLSLVFLAYLSGAIGAGMP